MFDLTKYTHLPVDLFSVIKKPNKKVFLETVQPKTISRHNQKTNTTTQLVGKEHQKLFPATAKKLTQRQNWKKKFLQTAHGECS
jgi:hypothetical protein